MRALLTPALALALASALAPALAAAAAAASTRVPSLAPPPAVVIFSPVMLALTLLFIPVLGPMVVCFLSQVTPGFFALFKCLGHIPPSLHGPTTRRNCHLHTFSDSGSELKSTFCDFPLPSRQLLQPKGDSISVCPCCCLLCVLPISLPLILGRFVTATPALSATTSTVAVAAVSVIAVATGAVVTAASPKPCIPPLPSLLLTLLFIPLLLLLLPPLPLLLPLPISLLLLLLLLLFLKFLLLLLFL